MEWSGWRKIVPSTENVFQLQIRDESKDKPNHPKSEWETNNSEKDVIKLGGQS